MPDIEVAWAAGLFEGEGCFVHLKPQPKDRFARFGMSLQMCDEDIVRRFAEIAGFGSVGTLATPSMETRQRKPAWRWRGYGVKAEAFARLLQPHFGVRRSGRMEEILRLVHEQHEEQNAIPRSA